MPAIQIDDAKIKEYVNIIKEENRNLMEKIDSIKNNYESYCNPDMMLFELEEVLPNGKTVSEAIENTANAFIETQNSLLYNQKVIDDLMDLVDSRDRNALFAAENAREDTEEIENDLDSASMSM